MPGKIRRFRRVRCAPGERRFVARTRLYCVRQLLATGCRAQ